LYSVLAILFAQLNIFSQNPLDIVPGSISTEINDGYYTVNFQVTGGSGNYIANNGNFDGSFFTSTLILCDQNIMFIITDLEGSAQYSTTITSPCNLGDCEELELLLVNIDCPNIGGMWIATFMVMGGTPPYSLFGNYMDDSFPGGFLYIQEDDGSNVTMQVTDSQGCSDSFAQSNILCLKCDYQIISEDDDPLYICENDGAIGNYSLTDENATFPENGVIGFAIQTLPGLSIGTILATNNTGVFTFSDLGEAQYGVTYYLTATAGSDFDGDGMPDINNPCTKRSSGIPVTFYLENLPDITISDVCNNETGVSTVMVFVSGGNPSPYYILSGYVSGAYLPSQFPLTLEVGDGQSIMITADDGSDCPGVVTDTSGPYTCTKTPIEIIDFYGTAEDKGNLIRWKIGSQINNKQFTLLPSNDNHLFRNL